MAKKFRTIIDEIMEQLATAGKKPHLSIANFSKDSDLIKFSPTSISSATGIASRRSLVQNDTAVTGEDKSNRDNNPEIKTNKNLALPSSSTIQQAAYIWDKEYLIVNFKSGHTYDYSDVPNKTIVNWEKASSAGHYFYYNIRKSFSYRKIS